MSNEILLKTLGDTLRRLERRREEAEEQRQAYQKKQQWQHEQWQGAEQRKQRAKEQIERSTEELDVLRTFMSSQQEQSLALVEQFNILQQRQVHLMTEFNLATDHVHRLHAEYQHVTGQLAGAEQDRRDAQREWDKISEQITRISLQGLTAESY